MRHSIALGLVIVAAAEAVLGACSSNKDLGDASNAGGTGASAGSGGGDASTDDGSASGCFGVLCGDQSLCCSADQECVAGSCLAACQNGVRCGTTCCGNGDLCVAATCVTPTTGCADSVDCAPKEFCEPGAGKCVPEVPGAQQCTYQRPVKPFAPVLKWSWESSTIQPNYDQAISAPLVADLDKDGTPDVVFTTTTGSMSTSSTPGFVRVVDGKTGSEKWPANVAAYLTENQVQAIFAPALADLDGDGSIEIVTMGNDSRLIAFGPDGSLRWKSTKPGGAAHTMSSWGSSISIADMDGDGHGEVVMGASVFDYQGVLVSGSGQHGAGGLDYAGKGSLHSSSSIIVDVDGDAKQEVVTGNTAYRMDGTTVWTNTNGDGFPGVADFDHDGNAELVVVTRTSVRVHDLATGVLRVETPLGLSEGGPPVIADFDGDGTPEIGVQPGCAFLTFEYDASQKTLTKSWETALKSCSGFFVATAFDFEGDGAVEILAHDDCYVSLLSGKTGTVLTQLPASHATWTEFVSVADVDGDLSADLLFSANDEFGGAPYNYASYCAYKSGETARHGVYVYSDPDGAWMPTRRIWNQQPYHITNIKSDGSLPKVETPSFGSGGYNDYRVSAQGKGAVNAADLVVNLSASLVKFCPAEVEMVATVQNQGSVSAPANVEVSFYAGKPPSGTYLGHAFTTQILSPGKSEQVKLTVTAKNDQAYYVVVDASSAGTGIVDECVETNNTATIAGVGCNKAPH
ncbi:MAG: FG-GAP-like repeat-containing protein [Polyangiaceae bacterium]